ncbi:MAG TPA: zinc-binding dehydrogenase [Candidatus Dormibacteraeota bacterium]|jgi:threonine dehydrogenase-like Zn-dependent dehydrogenase|nr:zinc-binding dehydrogenase [Candidatus Dormibacteraeota bacterium]
MLALQYVRSVPRYAALKATGGRPKLATGEFSVLHLGDVEDPRLPAAGWHQVRPRLAGICGSDLAAITGHASLYLDPLTSYPFVMGHEVVGECDGSRVVVEPALGCEVRGLDPVCARCAEGRPGLCENVDSGDLPVGLQTGYCSATGGGWGETLIAHPRQLHEVPASLADEAAVLVEPLACSVHAALRAEIGGDDVIVVQGAGTIGLLTVAAVRQLTSPRRLIAVAKHPSQREHALRLGADQVVRPDEAFQRIRFATSARRLDGRDRPLLLGGADATFECTGTAAGLNDAVRYTRAGGTVVAVGMPGEVKVDWAPIWQRELHVLGAYAYGVEGDGRRTFEIALELAPRLGLEALTGPLFGLGAYRDAITYALAAGRLGAVKVAFDLRNLGA